MKQKSAKDIAFDKERLKFRKQIKELEDEVNYWKAEADKNLIIAEHWEGIANELETKIGIPKEEILADIERRKKVNETIVPLLNFAKGIGGYY